MFKEIFLASIISTSVSLKTSNEDSQPHDYEYMISSEKKSDKYLYYIKRDWERELGEKYIDNVINIKYITDKNIYIGMDLVDKESKGIDFLTVNSGYKLKNKIECGLSFKSGKNSSFLASISYNENINKNKTEYLFSTSIKSNLSNQSIYNLNIDIKRWINDNVNLFVLGKYIYFDNESDFQFKIGAGIKI